MPLPGLSFPDPSWGRALSTAYDALVAVLREDPDLKRVVKAWKSWDGGPDDLADLTEAQLPWVEITPSLPALRIDTDIDYAAPFPITLRMMTGGTSIHDLLNLWGAIHQALRWDRPFRDRTVGEFLRDNGTNYHAAAGGGGTPILVDPGDWSTTFVIMLHLHVPA